MSQNRRIGRWRRVLTVEALEDRSLLSGNVTVSAVGIQAAALINGDNGNNKYTVNQTMNLGVPTLTVKGTANTFINGDRNGEANIPLPRGGLLITEGNGDDDVSIGQKAGFATGQLQTQFGNGNDELDINGMMLGQTMVSLGNGNDTFTFANSQTGNGNFQIGGGPGRSSLIMTGTQVNGSANIRLGTGFDVQLGQKTNQPISVAGDLNVSIGNLIGNDIEISARVGGNENIQIGDDLQSPKKSSVLITGSVGVNFNLENGSNLNTHQPMGLPITMMGMQVLGNDTIGPNPFAGSTHNNGIAYTVDPTDVGGTLTITMGDGGVNALESLTLLAVTSTDPMIHINSNPGDTVNVAITNFTDTDPAAQFVIRDDGSGNDHWVINGLDAGTLLKVVQTSLGTNFLDVDNSTAVTAIFYIGVNGTFVDSGGNNFGTLQVLSGPNPPP